MKRTFALALSLAAGIASAGDAGVSPDAGLTELVLVTAAPGRGVTFEAGERFSLNLRGRLQVRETLAQADTVTNSLNVRAVRMHLGGHLLSPDLRYLVQLAFGPSEADALAPGRIFDAFLEWKLHRDLSIRAGQYFVPFDRARTIREVALQFVDRPLAVTELNLDRDVGVTLLSEDLLGVGLRYALSVFGGQGRNRIAPEPIGFLYVARIGFRPFGAFDDDAEGDLSRSPEPHLALGVAAAYNRRTNRERSTTGQRYQEATFDYRHAAADVVFKWRGLSLMGEVLWRDSAVPSRSSGSTTEFAREGWGYLIQAGWMVSDRVEVASRWNQLRARDGTAPALTDAVARVGKELTVGSNLYLNGHQLKLQTDVTLNFGTPGSRSTILYRLQLDASF